MAVVLISLPSSLTAGAAISGKADIGDQPPVARAGVLRPTAASFDLQWGTYGDGDEQFRRPEGIGTASIIDYQEDFTEAEGWETSGCALGPGLWHQTFNPPVNKGSAPSYWYGSEPLTDPSPDYPPPIGSGPTPPCDRLVPTKYPPEHPEGDLCAFTGLNPHCGNLTSPRINLFNVPQPITLTFSNFMDKRIQDIARVEISVNGSEWFLLKDFTLNTMMANPQEEIDLSDYADSIIQLRWFMLLFESFTATNFYGWVIDDVEVKGGINPDDGMQRVYVADTGNHRVQLFEYEPDGDSAPSFTSGVGDHYGDGLGQFNSPEDAVVGPNQIVYVVDTANHRIQYFDADGSYIGQWGSYGDGDGLFKSPSGIAASGWHLTQSGLPFGPEWVADYFYIYVADTGNHRVQQFQVDKVGDGMGTFVHEWGWYGDGDGQFHLPEGIDVDPIETPTDIVTPPTYQIPTVPEMWVAHEYVADAGNHRIQYFTLDGTFEDEFGVYGDGDTQFNLPQDVGVGIRLEEVSTTAQRLVDVYVADTGNHRVQYFDETGSFNEEFGQYGDAEDQFNSLAGLAVDRLPPDEYPDAVGLEGDIFTIDTGNHRGQRFSRPQ